MGVLDARLVKLNRPASTRVAAEHIVVSADGTTVAYAQAESPSDPLSLYVVDVSTPGDPTNVAENLVDLGQGVDAFALLRERDLLERAFRAGP